MMKGETTVIVCLLLQLVLFWYWAYRRHIHFDGHHSYEETPVDFLEVGAYGETPPPIKARILGNVTELHWNSRNPKEVCSRLKLIDEEIDALKDGVKQEPLIIKNAIPHWSALRMWNFTWVANLERLADVWASPDMKFTYIPMPKLHALMKKDGAENLPNVVVTMTTREGIERMQANTDFEPLYYKNGEKYYMRFDVEESDEGAYDLDRGVFDCLGDNFKVAYRREDNLPRLWVSPPGAVSPLHFDKASSCLIQIRGKKRMLMYHVDDLDNLYPYPQSHLYARRGRVDPTNPNYDTFPKYRDVGGHLAYINPGDVFCFPARFAHYTETLSSSISLTVRF